jgi:bifunctional enzyme CysN/CysC
MVRKGDEVMVLPSRKKSRVASIVTYDGELTEAQPPLAVTITLEDELDVSRGDMLVHPHRQPIVSSDVEAMIVWMNEKPLVQGRPYWIKQTTHTVTGEVAEIRYSVDVNTLEENPARQLAMNEVGHIRLSLNQPLAYDAYRSNSATGAFIVIDRITNNTVGAGMILDRGDGRSSGDKWGRSPTSNRLEVRTSEVPLAARERQLAQRGVSILLTGPTGSGKVTIAYALEKKLFELGHKSIVLTGQNMRQGLCRDLGFSADERSENLRRSAEVAKILNDAGLIAICAFLAPHEAVRRKAREVIGANRFLEVYLSAPIDVCKQRDTSGAYSDGGAGISYEAPTSPDIVLPTHELAVEDSVNRLIDELDRRGFLKATS